MTINKLPNYIIKWLYRLPDCPMSYQILLAQSFMCGMSHLEGITHEVRAKQVQFKCVHAVTLFTVKIRYMKWIISS